jgi:hypothetical protein
MYPKILFPPSPFKKMVLYLFTKRDDAKLTGRPFLVVNFFEELNFIRKVQGF